MIRKIVAVKDLASQLFGQPIFVPAVGSAVRDFSNEVRRPGSYEQPNNMNLHPEDFELWELGSFDDESGAFSGGPVLVIRGKDVADNGAA